MLVIRYTRIGKKNQPSFRVVLVDKRRSSKAGRSIEILGTHNPTTKRTTLKKERILYWISKGAKPSPSINNLLVKEKVVEGKKIAKHKTKPVEVVATAPVAPAPATPTPEVKTEVKPAETA